MSDDKTQSNAAECRLNTIVSRFSMSNEHPIDKEIKPLCEALNKLDGVTTIFSCSGHEGTSGYVSFTCASQDTIGILARRLPLSTITNHTEHGPIDLIYVHLKVELCQFQLVYCIRWGGMNADFQKQARKQVIDALCS